MEDYHAIKNLTIIHDDLIFLFKNKNKSLHVSVVFGHRRDINTIMQSKIKNAQQISMKAIPLRQLPKN